MKRYLWIVLSVLTALTLPSQTLCAADFDWIVTLNLRSHSDPYAYRYSLMDRFGYNEAEVVSILDSVYEPADAYMIFRLAELSNKDPHYVLSLYRERRFSHWDDMALYLDIPVYAPPFMELRRHHDIVYRYVPPVHYEENRYYVVRPRPIVVQPPHREYAPRPLPPREHQREEIPRRPESNGVHQGHMETSSRPSYHDREEHRAPMHQPEQRRSESPHGHDPRQDRP